MQSQAQRSAQVHAPSLDRRGLFLALALLLLGAFLRCPSILIHGRMWGEELPVFLVGNWNHSLLFALSAQHFGYFSVWDNLLAAAAVHWIPLTGVALLFSWSGVAMLLLTACLVYTAEFLPTRTARLLGVLALLLTAPSMETWINLLNSEFFFGIWSAVILLSDASRLRTQRTLALILAVLSGPLTTLLAPLFVLRALYGRTRPQILQALIVSLGGGLQIAIAAESSIAGRSVHPNPLTVAPPLFHHDVVMLFFSRVAAMADLLFLRDHLHFSHAALLFCWTGLLLAAALLFALLRSVRPALLLLGVAAWMATLEAMLGLGGGWALLSSGERYSFLPNYLIELALIVCAVTAAASPRRTAARVLLALAMLSGLVDYLLFPIRSKLLWQGEPWRQQALRWGRDPTTPLHALPLNWPPSTLPPRALAPEP